jgi:hypothetical protein
MRSELEKTVQKAFSTGKSPYICQKSQFPAMAGIRFLTTQETM